MNSALDELSSCDREKISLVGSIQPHGYFLAFKMNDKTIYHASENVINLFNRPETAVVGQSLESLFGLRVAELILTKARKVENNHAQFFRLKKINEKTGPYEFFVYPLDGLFAIEIESRSEEDLDDEHHLPDPRRQSQFFIEALDSTSDLTSIAKSACKSIRAMISYERVMIYRYLPNWDGEVIAEDKSAEAHSFLNHRFPSTDIPLPARELYLKNKSRLILDSAATAIPIYPSMHYLTRKMIDLTPSKLRAVSLIHLEYLRNMKVVSSFSVAIIVEGQLWGLIACHSGKKVALPHEIRLASETIAATFAALANMKQLLQAQNNQLQFEDSMRDFFRNLIKSDSVVQKLFSKHLDFQDMFKASGIALVSLNGIEIAGLVPPENYIRQIGEVFKARAQRDSKGIYATDNLGKLDQNFQALQQMACGVLAISSTSDPHLIFLIFRAEALQTVVWGGDPRKNLEKRNYQGTINPRTSFESWTETLKGYSQPWQNYELKGAEFLRDFLFNDLIKKEQLISELGQKLRLT